jgi:hypothetical protein
MLYDIETESMAAVASMLTHKHHMYWPQIRRGIRERVAMFEAGRLQPPRWFIKRLKEEDDQLDCRWDYQNQQWLIERFSRKDRAWVTVLPWKDHLDIQIFMELRKMDTWRYSTIEDYMRHKRAESAAIRERNRKRGDEKVLAAVDSLTKKRVEEFIEVERALHTGETVYLAGESEKSAERMYKGSQRAAQEGTLIDESKIKIDNVAKMPWIKSKELK